MLKNENMKTKILILFFVFANTFCFAENRQVQVDSLQLRLKTQLGDTERVNTLNELALQLYEMDLYDNAMLYAKNAQTLSTKMGFKNGIATSFKRIGAIQTQQGNYPLALENFFQSLKIYENIGDQMGVFLVYNNIGSVYYYQSDHDKALDYYFRAEKNNFNKGLTYSNIGRVYADKGNYTEAKEYFSKAIHYYETNNDKNNIALIINNMGAVYEGMGKNDSALIYYSSALEIKTQIGDKIGVCDALGSIGDIYFKLKEYERALKYQNQCLLLAKEINYLNSICQTENIISQIYSTMRDCPSAFIHYKNYIAVRDSMYNEENTKKMVVSEMNFEQAKKDVIKEEQLKRQRIIKNTFIGGFLLLLIFSFFIFRSFRRSQKQKMIIEKQKQIVEHSKKEITDSIAYAKNIQAAILPSEEYLKINLPENFIIYKPKDIVSGDFYWAFKDENSTFFAAADCTGHGVPGSMLSMLACSLLNEIVIERHITEPDLVLNTLRDEIIKALNPAGATQERKDGLDLVFCKVTANTLTCAAANNPIYVVRDSKIIEIKSNRFPVGKYITNHPFTKNQMQLQKGDIIYTLSDGFCDQFGHETGKKLMTKRFKEWIVELSPLELPQIKLELECRFENWIGRAEQIDDVTVFAVKI